MMKHKRRNILMHISLVILLLMMVGAPFSYAQKSSSPQIKVPSKTVSNVSQDNNVALERQLNEIQRILSAQEDNTNKKIEKLEATIQSQKKIINEMEFELKSLKGKPLTNGTTFEVWSGILLGCVAVMVTILGVGVALLSFIGYRELIKKGTEKASLVAAEKTEKEFQRFIKQGKLDAVIAEGINRITYRDISSNSEANGDIETRDERNEND